MLSHNIDILWDSRFCPCMAEGVNVRFSGELQRFVQSRSAGDGLYASASEYIRDLVRRDYERNEFVPLDASEIVKEAKAQRKARGS